MFLSSNSNWAASNSSVQFFPVVSRNQPCIYINFFLFFHYYYSLVTRLGSSSALFFSIIELCQGFSSRFIVKIKKFLQKLRGEKKVWWYMGHDVVDGIVMVSCDEIVKFDRTVCTNCFWKGIRTHTQNSELIAVRGVSRMVWESSLKNLNRTLIVVQNLKDSPSYGIFLATQSSKRHKTDNRKEIWLWAGMNLA
jgi:hypothetical protein